MSIKPQTPGVHHVGLRVTDIARARRLLLRKRLVSQSARLPDVFLFAAGGTAIGVRGPAADTPPGDRFNSSRVGLDHVALGCADESELNRVAEALQAAGVENTGVKLDETLERYVAFKDPRPDCLEFYTT